MNSIRDWYTTAFPSDNLGKEIDADITFGDVIPVLENRKDIYKELGVSDSIVRERIFGEVSRIMSIPYDFIYNLWLYGRIFTKEELKVWRLRHGS